MRLVDAHIHLSSPKYTNIEDLVKRSKKEGVVAIVSAGSDLNSSYRTLEIGRKFPKFVFPSLGFHPEQINVSENEVEGVMKLIRRAADEMVAVGEIGLPYYSIKDNIDFHQLLESVKPRFRFFLDLARDLDLAVVIHAPHEAAEEALEVIRKVGNRRVLFHWHKSPPDVTKAIVEGGYYVSVTPEVCYRDRDKKLIQLVPISNLLLETDGPWLYDREFKGKVTEPTFIKRIAKEVAELVGTTEEEVAERTTENAIRLFKLSL